MLFLQSVTKNADKLKDSTESKVCTFFTILVLVLDYDRESGVIAYFQSYKVEPANI
jgi:hypothetical protein